MKMTSKKKRILSFSVVSAVLLVVPSVALGLNSYSLESQISAAKNSNQSSYNGTISDDFIKNLSKEQILKNIRYDSNGKLIPLKVVESNGKVYQPINQLVPSDSSEKEDIVKTKDYILNTPKLLDDYNQLNGNVKSAFVSNLPKELVGKKITLDKNSSMFLNSFLGTNFKENEKFEFTDFASNLYDVASQKSFNQDITSNDVANAATVLGLNLNKEVDNLISNPSGYSSSFNNLMKTNLNSSVTKIVSINRQFGVGASKPKKQPSVSDVNKATPSSADVEESQEANLTVNDFNNLISDNKASRYAFSIIYTALAIASLLLTVFYVISLNIPEALSSTFDTICATTSAAISWLQYDDLYNINAMIANLINTGLNAQTFFSAGKCTKNLAENIKNFSEIITNVILKSDKIKGIVKFSVSVISVIISAVSVATSVADFILSNAKNSLNS